jgi:Lrp/AsnC family leucine-responsive transcriptional regulator
MARKSESPILDDKAWRLLLSLQRDGRASLKTHSKAAGLSVAATAERVRRLEEDGFVRRIGAEVDLKKLGYSVQAIIGITVVQPGKKPFLEKLKLAPEVLDCYHVAGADSYIMTVIARDLEDLERFIGTINDYGETRTSIVYSTPIARRLVVKPGTLRRSS